MGVAMKQFEVMDWSKFTIDEWLKQYAAFLSINRMRGGHEPDHMEINTIYWLVRENDTSGRSSSGKFVYLQISEFEYEQVDKLIYGLMNSDLITGSARVCVRLYLLKMINGWTEEQLSEKFVLSKSKLREMAYCGKFYICGHDKRLTLDPHK